MNVCLISGGDMVILEQRVQGIIWVFDQAMIGYGIATYNTLTFKTELM